MEENLDKILSERYRVSLDDIKEIDNIRADIYSRPNFYTRVYHRLQLDFLKDLEDYKTGYSIIINRILLIQANQADKMILDAREQNIDISDPVACKILSNKINEECLAMSAGYSSGWFIYKYRFFLVILGGIILILLVKFIF